RHAGGVRATGGRHTIDRRGRHRPRRIVDLGLPRRLRALGVVPAPAPGLRPRGRALPAVRRPGPGVRRDRPVDLLLRALPALTADPWGRNGQAPEIAGQLIDYPGSRLLPSRPNDGRLRGGVGALYAVSIPPGTHNLPERPPAFGGSGIVSASRGDGAPDPLLAEHLHAVLPGPDRGARHGRPRPDLYRPGLPHLHPGGDDPGRDRAVQEGRRGG